MAFRFESLEIPDVVLVRATRHGDARGWFAETYKRSEFIQHGISEAFVQDNDSFSAARGTLRGLHFQRPPRAQAKLVRCLAGAIYDVAVDLRGDSATYGQWVAVELRPEAGTTLWIPAGFAHAFQTLEPDTRVAYKTTDEYDTACESGIRWDDPRLAISWPIERPILSSRDAALPLWQPSHPPFSR